MYSICGFNIGRIIATKFPVEDFTYFAPWGIIFSMGEILTGIMVACVPTLGPVFFPQRYKRRATSGRPIVGQTKSTTKGRSAWTGSSKSSNSRSFMHSIRKGRDLDSLGTNESRSVAYTSRSSDDDKYGMVAGSKAITVKHDIGVSSV